MKTFAAISRVVLESFGVLLIMFVALPRFGAHQIAAFIAIVGLLASVEAAVASAVCRGCTYFEKSKRGRASCAPLVAVVAVAILAVSMRPEPRFEPSKFARVQLQALIERHG